jgi:hypothetical protein
MTTTMSSELVVNTIYTAIFRLLRLIS